MTNWERCAEGFEGLDVEERRVKRAKERSGSHRLYKDDLQQVLSEEEDQIEDSITWTSSEEETEDIQMSTVKNRHRKVAKTVKGQKAATQRQRGQPAHYLEDVSVISESDSNSNMEDFMKNTSEGIELDIESEDSRSSIPTNEKSQNLSQSKNETKVICYSPCISELTSISPSTSQSQSPDKNSKVKASQWIKMLDLKTPTKNSQDAPFTELEDSAKKRKKYQKGSLADQLFNLKGRERSMISMFKHQKSTTVSPKLQSEDTPVKSLTLRITRLESLFSVRLAHCVQQESGVMVGKEQTALFLQDQSLQEGNVVRVFAPWQQIRLKQSSQHVLLCSNYCIMSDEGPVNTLMSETGNTDRPRDKKSNHNLTEVSAVWKCPCVLGLVKSSFACPAHLSPGIPGLYVNKLDKESELENDEQLSALDTIQATQGPSRKDRLTKSSILEWVDCHDPSARFSGRILRVFCFNRRVPSNEKRYSLLIEDSHGTMCQVFCPENFEVHFPSVLKSGEGQLHVFGGLTVQYRATRDREPGLFSMIDSVWSGGFMSKRAGSQNTRGFIMYAIFISFSQLFRTSAPGFCYFMKEAENGEGINIEANGVDNPISKEKTIRLADLDQVEEIRRVSFCCQVLFQIEMGDVKDSVPLSDSRRSHNSILYVRDQSLTNHRYITMTTTAECSLPLLTHLKNRTWKFRDVACQSGKLTCDLYSCIITQTQEPLESSCDLDLKPIHPGLTTFDLCTVSGSVCDVDENSAYTWDVCDKCQQENLAQDSSSRQLVCLTCQRAVKEPLTRMKLKVYLSVTSSHNMMSSDYPEMKVSVELHQSSIEKILPDSDEADEGYDISSVLGRHVGPLNCVVLESNQGKATFEMTVKEINLDLQEP
ncbi:DNA repair-scaffolding protein-like [Saccostrea echinata]|uniref:DNA repair-scaffolding protein-like n=1 Tax=Saccostrea echinata TaxID=191078 RepID=UPI002A7FFBED|nr:DNA repair-scaffolding protein-like [Saccostrea echinata]